jgi:hypothetical protein
VREVRSLLRDGMRRHDPVARGSYDPRGDSKAPRQAWARSEASAAPCCSDRSAPPRALDRVALTCERRIRMPSGTRPSRGSTCPSRPASEHVRRPRLPPNQPAQPAGARRRGSCSDAPPAQITVQIP